VKGQLTAKEIMREKEKIAIEDEGKRAEDEGRGERCK
jgi:hypothetical protein